MLSNEQKIISNLDTEDWQLILCETGEDTQTGGRVFKIKKYVEDDEFFFLTYGDGVSDVDPGKILDFHKSHGKLVTVMGGKPLGRFGYLQTNSDRVVEFNEKKIGKSEYVSAGFFVCSRDVFKYLNNRDDLVFEQEPLKNLVKDRQLMVYKHDGFWQPMDTSSEFQFLNKIWDSGNAPWKKW